MSGPKITIKNGTRKEIVVNDMPFEEFLDRLTVANVDKATVTIADDGGIQIDLADYTFRNESWQASTVVGSRKAVMPMQVEVPVSAKYLLLLIPKKYRESLLGDLTEEFQTIVLPTFGPRKARLWYWWHTIISLFPFFARMLRRVLGFVFISKLIGK